MPKNSPWRTSNETPRSARSSRVLAARERMQRALLERVDAVLRDPEGLLDVADLDDHRALGGGGHRRPKGTRRSDARPPAPQPPLLEARARPGRLASQPPARRARRPGPRRASASDAARRARTRCPASRCGRPATRSGRGGEPGERRRRALGGDEAPQRAALARASAVAAAGEQRLGQHGARQIAAEVRAAAAAQQREPRRPRRPPCVTVAEERARVLDVVVERAVDVGDVARAPARRAPIQWSWNWQARRVRERQRQLRDLAPEQRRRAGDRCWRPAARRGRCGCCAAPATASRAARAPSGVDEPLVGVDELRGAERRRAARASLSGVPAVVLVAQRDQLGLGRRQPQRALEVAVEAEPRAPSATRRSAGRRRPPRSAPRSARGSSSRR